MAKCVEIPKARAACFQEHYWSEQEMHPELDLNLILIEQSKELAVSPKCFLWTEMCFNQSLMCAVLKLPMMHLWHRRQTLVSDEHVLAYCVCWVLLSRQVTVSHSASSVQARSCVSL